MKTTQIAPATVAAALATAELETLDGCAAFVDQLLGAGTAAKLKAQKKSVRGKANELAALAPVVVAQADEEEVRVTAAEQAPAPAPAAEPPAAPAEVMVVDAEKLAEVEELVLMVAPDGTAAGRTSKHAGEPVKYVRGLDPSADDYYVGLAQRGQKRHWWSARVGILFSRRAKTAAERLGISLPPLPWKSDVMADWAETAMTLLAGYRQN